MSRPGGSFYAFGPYRLDLDDRILFEGARPVPLTPKAVETLLVLVSRHGHVVGKEELMRVVWPDTVVEENNLTQNISALRKALGDADGHRFIETVPRRGYRFVAEVAEPGEPVEGTPRGQGGAAMPGESAPNRPWFLRWRLAALLIGLGALLVALATRGWRAPSREPFARMRIAPLTNSGNVAGLALSPDGRQLALALDENGRQALWVRQLAMASGVRIVPPADMEYWGVTFAPDGHFVYYVSWEPNRAEPVLARVPVLGGTPQMLDFESSPPDGPVSFSPDGRRVAYLFSMRSESRLVVANADGTEPRTLASRRDPVRFASRPGALAWSPDGSTVAVGVAAPGTAGWRAHVLAVRMSDGAERVIGSSTWFRIGRIAWLSDGKGMLLSASQERWAPRQIWQVSFPDGAVRRITNDLDEYGDLGLSPQAETLVALQTACVSSLWIAPGGRAGSAKRVATEAGKFEGIEGMAWTADGRLVYRSRAGGSWDLWMLDPSQQEPRQLTFDRHSELHPSVSPDGASVVFVSDQSGRYALYRMPLDGGDAVRLTDAVEDAVYPSWAGDGSLVVFQAGGMIQYRPASIWRIRSSGGAAARLAEPQSMRPAVSPDGQRVAYYSLHDGHWVIRVVPIEGGPPIATFSIPPSASRTLRWMPDGGGLAYIVTVDGVSNVWQQPLQGGSPQPVTDFTSDRMFDFAWSRDGRLLAVVRAVETSDAVRITDFR